MHRIRGLYVVVFVSGMVLMSLEMLGSRLMAPYFGTAVHVWGSLISVFMIALSLGYFLGGKVADRWPRLESMAYILLVAGLATGLIPVISDPLNRTFQDWDPRYGSLMAAAVTFLPATVLLGMISPFAVRLRVQSVEAVGAQVGGLSAVATAGSIVGTLGTTFWLVPLAGTKTVVSALAAVLFLLAGLAFVMEHSRVKATWALLLTVLTLVAGPSNGVAGRYEFNSALGLLRTVYATESAYHNIRVMDGAGSRFLRFDDSWQTAMKIDDPYESGFPYTDYFQLAPVFTPEVKDVLMIGLGGGAAPKRFWRDYPGVQVDVAEIDPRVVDVARQYFALPQDPRIQVHVGDGRRFLERSPKQYDLIILDAYFSHSVPFHLTTSEFMTAVKAHLKPDGVAAFNVIGAITGPGSKFFRSIYRTVGESMPDRYLFGVDWAQRPDPTAQRNLILFAGQGHGMSPDAVRAAIQRLAPQATVKRFAEFAGELYTKEIPVGDVPTLTDDHAPVDNLIRVDR